MLALRHTLARNGVARRSLVATAYQTQWNTISAEEAAAKQSGDYTNVSQVNDWENFRNQYTPYEGQGPLPPVSNQIPVEAQLRLGAMPEAWFKVLEPKLGYTGGYTLFWGGLLALTSKEIIIWGPEMTWAFWAWVVIPPLLHAGLFPTLEKESMISELAHIDRVNKWKEYKLGLAESEVDGIARLKEQASGLSLIQEQRKNNLAMALEAEYINRKADLTEAVKKRLDYHVAVNNATRDAQSRHMINWIEAEVQAAIAKRSPKEDLNAAIAQLKAMAK